MKNWILLILIGFGIGACTPMDELDLPELEQTTVDMGDCFRELVDSMVVVQNQTDLENLRPFIETTFSTQDCSTVPLPIIDFSSYTLLGNQMCGSGCDREFIKRVYNDAPNQQYIYQITLKEQGACEPWVCGMNWILVPKLPSGYSVEFVEL